MSTVYEDAVHTLREVGERIAHEVPTTIPSGLSGLIPSNLSLSNVHLPSNLHLPSDLVPSGVTWPDDLVDRVSGRRDRNRRNRRNQVLIAGAAVAVIAGVVWLTRRRRATDHQDVGVGADRDSASAA